MYTYNLMKRATNINSFCANCILMVATVIAGLASLLLLIGTVMMLGAGRISEALVAMMGAVLFLALVIVFTRVQRLEP